MLRVSCASALALVLAAAPAAADPPSRAIELGFSGGLFFPSADHEFFEVGVVDQEPLAALAGNVDVRLGLFPTSFIGIEGEAGYISAALESRDARVNLTSFRGHLIVQIPLPVTIFALGGVGATYSRSDASVQGDDVDRVFHVGAGAKMFISRRFQLRVDGRVYRAPRFGDGDTDHYAVSAGLAVSFGGGGGEPRRKAAPKPDPGDDAVDAAVVADRDGDGFTDANDACPDRPETANGYQDDDGCPDELPDSDGDGIPDDKDGCDADPEDLDGFDDSDGCPDPDNDDDSVVDSADNCVNEPGPIENRGCPDADRDGDGVADRLDNCPDQKGSAANHGCITQQMVVLTRTKIEILDKVYFRTNRAQLQRRSNRLLDNIARVLDAHPEILKVRIEGHTDSHGSAARNRRLSTQRARAVAGYLRRKGIAGSRLDAVGLGASEPIENNETARGRAANRRVEIEIVETAAIEAGQSP